MRADPRGDRRVGGVHGDGVGRRAGVLVVLDHLRQIELFGALRKDRRADESRTVPHHEGHLLSGHGFGGDDQVRFVLATGVIEDNDELAISCQVLCETIALC